VAPPWPNGWAAIPATFCGWLWGHDPRCGGQCPPREHGWTLALTICARSKAKLSGMTVCWQCGWFGWGADERAPGQRSPAGQPVGLHRAGAGGGGVGRLRRAGRARGDRDAAGRAPCLSGPGQPRLDDGRRGAGGRGRRLGRLPDRPPVRRATQTQPPGPQDRPGALGQGPGLPAAPRAAGRCSWAASSACCA
jgi:hypothetical protein